MTFPEKPIALPQLMANQSVLVHGSEAKDMGHVPKLIRVICKRIRDDFDSGTYSLDHIAYSIYQVSHKTFEAPFYQAFVSGHEISGSYDETVFQQSPQKTGGFEGKLSVYKRLLNEWRWTELINECDIRVLTQLMLDWLEQAVFGGYYSDAVMHEALHTWSLNKSVATYTPLMKSFISKDQFTTISHICSQLLSPLVERDDWKQVLSRVVVALQGIKYKFEGCFAGRNLVELPDLAQDRLYQFIEKKCGAVKFTEIQT